MAGPNGPCEAREMTFWVAEWPRTIRGRCCFVPPLWKGPSPREPRVESKISVRRLGCGAAPETGPGGAFGPFLGRVFDVGGSGVCGSVALALVGSLALLSLALSTGGVPRTPCNCSAPRGFVGAVAV